MLFVLALASLAFTTNGRPQAARTFCRIGHVLAFNDEFDLGIVAVGPYLPDTVMTKAFADLPAPVYPSVLVCARPRAEPEPQND